MNSQIDINKCFLSLVFLLVIINFTVGPCDSLDSSSTNSALILNVYAGDTDTGKAIVTGYASRIDGLPFLNSSDHIFENDTNQLYAVTDTLMNKTVSGIILTLAATGYYDQYHITFYTPSSLVPESVETSGGLWHQSRIAEESNAVEVQGVEVADPVVVIEYAAG